MNNLSENTKINYAYFAGGCFWCMVSPFDVLDGIIEVISGYTGGNLKNPTYQDVKGQNSGHYEAIKITYDENIISYNKLLDAFWRQIDPTDDEGQFQDRGLSYRSAIFYVNEDQQIKAENSKKDLENSKRFSKPIVTKIIKFKEFYPAEDFHQNFYKTHPDDYKKDRNMSGRDTFINKYWGDDYYSIYD